MTRLEKSYPYQEICLKSQKHYFQTINTPASRLKVKIVMYTTTCVKPLCMYGHQLWGTPKFSNTTIPEYCP
ncbi:hypothetical protein FWK35_00036886 [Aphis craccivora]|uniref:Uncharacterized protein n=1 Tax=Aphis craccivora TaxID=307492 RepID=A0A6G0W0X2_APHCR|nr:hypothetical protein FWK35_00036886 [Aphis craccivora]